ncbi:hypothetical protein ACFWUU_23155 [Kribbella sp. NPDC058693]|uniref:hypothetical protein n=1 Tax=Kribbella sp. NPDC058693 TaxID=3346602 RepID=UPI003655A596
MALALAAAGFDVWVTGRTEEKLQETAAPPPKGAAGGGTGGGGVGGGGGPVCGVCGWVGGVV